MRSASSALLLTLTFSGALAAQTAGREAAPPAARTAAVSPGSPASFAPAASPCPTFSWTEEEAASAYELRVLRVTESGAADETPALSARVPAGASVWTTPGDRCLEPGERYAWSVRALTAEGSGSWSEALLFEVAEPEVDLATALAVLRRYLGPEAAAGTGPAATSYGATSADVAAGAPAGRGKAEAGSQSPQGGGPATALRGEVPDAAGETYGVHGVANSPDGAGVRADNNAAGADLVLGGAPVAELTESGFSRDSAGNVLFNFTNPGAGAMVLQVEGVDVLTDAAGPFVDEAGDTMTGALNLISTADYALNLGDDSHVNLGLATRVSKDQALFLHDTGVRNLGLGRVALANLTTGASNTALGYHAGYFTSSGAANTAVGSYALYLNTLGSYNTAVGHQALALNTGTRNTATGSRALRYNTTGYDNTASGYAALRLNTTGFLNTAVGRDALHNNGTGVGNTAVGHSALRLNTTGASNTALGRLGLFANTTGNLNTALGRSALAANTTGLSNTGVGAYALDANTTGFSNTALGQSALGGNTTGNRNTAVGGGALGNATGIYNVAVGYLAGLSITDGDDNILIGNQGVGGDSGRIRIGEQGTQSSAFIAGIHGNVTAGGIAVFVNSSGEVGTSTSSRRFKEAIEEIGDESSRLMRLRAVRFRYTEEAAGGGERPLEYGLIAEEVAEVLPELVAYDDEGRPHTVRYHLLTPMLLAELQRQ